SPRATDTGEPAGSVRQDSVGWVPADGDLGREACSVLDIKLIRNEPDKVREAMRRRGEDAPIDEVLALDEQRRSLVTEVEQLKARRNQVSEEIARAKRAGQDATEIIAAMREVSDRIKALDDQVRDVEARLEQLLLTIPNIPHESVPYGQSEEDNVEVRRWGEPRQFDFAPKAHWDIGTGLGILDFER